jgi:hypothetical protein
MIPQCSEDGQFLRRSAVIHASQKRSSDVEKCPAKRPAGLPTRFDEIGGKLLLPAHFERIYKPGLFDAFFLNIKIRQRCQYYLRFLSTRALA